MATVLELYNKRKQEASQQIAAGNLPPENLLQHQELLYRINVLETCMAYSKTAPVTPDRRVLITHYRLVDGFLNCVIQERKMGVPIDEKGQKQRETAYTNFLGVVNDYRRKFNSFAPNTQDEYRNLLTQMIQTILPAWLAYRNTLVNL